jgi:HNH endonuclease
MVDGMECIYCTAIRPLDFPKEHVVPKAFGRFRNSLTLDCVCDECNTFFGRELEVFLNSHRFIADNQAIAGALVMAIPGATRVVVPDAGHLMYLEKPEVFSGLVSAFLTAHAF